MKDGLLDLVFRNFAKWLELYVVLDYEVRVPPQMVAKLD